MSTLLVVCAIASAFTGCSTVTFKNLPPQEYLDRSDVFVGTIAITDSKSSTVLTVSNPDGEGRRILWVCGAKHRGENANTDGEYRTYKTPLYLYEIDGRHFAFVRADDERDGYLVLNLEHSSGVLKFRAIDKDRFMSVWPTRNFSALESFEPYCTDDADSVLAAFADERLRGMLFGDSPAMAINVQSGTMSNESGQTIPLRYSKISMRMPGSPSRLAVFWLLSIAFFVAFARGVRVTCKNVLVPFDASTCQLRETAPANLHDVAFVSDRYDRLHRDVRAFAKDSVLVCVGVVFAASTITLSTQFLTFGILCSHAFSVVVGLFIGSWLTIENHTLVQLLSNAVKITTLRRAAVPVIVCVILVSPGLIATKWIENQILSIATLVPESVDVSIPGVSGYRPVVREPTWNDGIIKCAFGIPIVDSVKYEIEGQQITLDSLSFWRSALIGLLSAAYTIATITLLLLLLRVIIGIVLRIAATDASSGVIYCPTN